MNAPSTSKHPSAHSGLRFRRLANGMELAYQTRSELAHFYEDIFEKGIYVKNGIELEDGACVFDVGANIGLFTLYVHNRFNNIESYSFEPAPPLFEIACANVARYAPEAKMFNVGISDSKRTASFCFYPNSSGMSSFYADIDEEKAALLAIMLNQLRKGMPGMEQLMKQADDLLEQRFKSQTFECHLQQLSEIIRAHGVAQIDLLKIDAQKSELDALLGVDGDDWERIRQVVVEVHNISGRLDQITTLLRERGFKITVEQDEMYKGSVMFNLYATKPKRPASRFNRSFPERRTGSFSMQRIQDRAKKREQMAGRQRELINERRRDK